jgi:hypothetical protein
LDVNSVFEAIDPYIKGIEEGLKLPAGVTSRQMIPEIMARIVELPIDVIANDVTAAKVMKGILGVFFAVAPQQILPLIAKEWDKHTGYPGRDTEDTYAMAKMWLLEATDPTPDDMVKIANAIQNLRQGFAFGDANRIASVFGVKSLATIQSDWVNVANAFATAFGMPGAKSPPKPNPAGSMAPLYKETLGGPGVATATPLTPAGPTGVPGVAQLFRFTSDHLQPKPPSVTPRFRMTIG